MRSGLLAAAGAALLLLGTLATVPYPEGPPPGHTGGFGEPTCLVCHFGGPENPTAGSIGLHGPPVAWAPGRAYDLTVRVSHPELARAGFQLSARFAAGESEGEQAGRLAGVSPRVAVTPGLEGEILYAHQTLVGSEVVDTVTEWRVVWVAPEGPRAPVAFHLAANAANDDASELGDVILSLELSSEPDPER